MNGRPAVQNSVLEYLFPSFDSPLVSAVHICAKPLIKCRVKCNWPTSLVRLTLEIIKCEKINETKTVNLLSDCDHTKV